MSDRSPTRWWVNRNNRDQSMKIAPWIFLAFSLVSGTGLARTEKAVTLHLQEVGLGHALRQLATQADIHLVYPDAVVDSLLISCDLDKVAVREAVKRLLHNTSLSFKQQGPDELVIFLKNDKLTFDIAGSVFDAETGERLPYANVLLVGTDRGTASNQDGRFVLPVVPAETRTLRVTYIGYAHREIQLNRRTLATPLHIGLKKRNILTEPVTVVPGNWELINVAAGNGQLAIALENFSLLPIIGDKDIFRSLQLLPGVSSSNQGSADLYVRGGTPSQNLVLFDGMTLYHLDHSFGYFSAFNADAIKDVRIYKGGIPAKYGGRLSSVMEVTAKSGDFRTTRLQVGANPLNGHAVLELPFAGAGGLLLSVRHSYSEYILEDLYDRNFSAFASSIPRRQPLNFRPSREIPAPNVNPDISFYDIIAKASLVAGTRDKITASLYLGQDNLERFETFAAPGDPRRQMRSRETTLFAREEQADWGNQGYSFNWFRQWQERLQSTAMVAYSKFSSEQSFFENSPAFAPDPRFSGHRPRPGATVADSALFELSSNNDIEDLTFRLDNSWQMHPGHKLGFGAWISRTEIDYTNNGFDVILGLRASDRATQYAYYLQDAWSLNPLTLEAGLRATYYDQMDSLYVEPRISADLAVLPGISLRGSWGKNHQFVRRMPGFFQYTEGRDFWVLANGNAIEPGQAEQWTAGLKLQNARLLFDLEVYERRQQDVTEGIPAVQYMALAERTTVYRNNRSLSRGLDVLLERRSGRFTSWASYSYNDTDIEATVSRTLQEFPANQNVPHKLNLVGSYTHNGWNLSATWTYASGAPYTQPEIEAATSSDFGSILRLVPPDELNRDRLPVTHRLDLSLTRSFITKHFYGNVGFSIYNVYDRENVWYRNFELREGELVQEDVPTLGFTPTVSVDLRIR